MKYHVHSPAEAKHPGGCGLCHVQLDRLGVRRGRDVILDNVSMAIHCGELTALIGRNGAGKTTLIRAILGEIRHTGTVSYTREDGHNAEKPIIGYVPQHLEFDKSSPVSVEDFMISAMGGRPVWLPPSRSQKDRVRRALEAVDMDGLSDRRLGELSGGELQRVMLAAALDPMPDVLVLDEPVSGVDQRGLSMFYSRVSALREGHHMAILLVSHDLEIVRRYADRVVVLEKTILAEGAPSKVLLDPEVREIFAGEVSE